MKKAIAALALIACIVVAATAVIYISIKSRQPAREKDEFNSVDGWFSELDDLLGFENQAFDDDLSGIFGDWG
jgi:hypothetical protein